MGKPSILFVNQHYYPAFVAAGQQLTDLAEHLAAAGMDVHVLCGRSGYEDESRDAPKEEVHEGVRIHRLGMADLGRKSYLARTTDYATFYLQVLARVLAGRRYDYVIVLTTPPLLGLVGAMARRLRGQRYGIWSMDLHPDAEEALGLLRSDQGLTRLLHRLNNTGYRNADFVVDLGYWMKQRLLRKGVPAGRLHTLPTWNKKDEVCPVPRAENPLVRELGLEDKFVVMYSGNAGLVHRFDEVTAAMQQLKAHPHLFFLFAGGGPRRKDVEAFARANDIRNFRYLSYFPREQLKYSLSLGDVHLLTLREDMAGIAVPSKLYGIMASGRPVVMVGPRASEPAETIAEAEVGFVVDPAEHPGQGGQRLAGHLLQLYEDPALRAALGARAYDVYLERFEQQVVCRAWADLLRRLLGKR
jgi:glycosyltransferase involved in cell wall biosynthesis